MRLPRPPTAVSGCHPPVIRISNGTFFRHHPGAQQKIGPLNVPLFSNLNFELPSKDTPTWCVVGPSLSGKTSLLRVLQGNLLCDPPTARLYPYISSDAVPLRQRNPRTAFRYVGFDVDSEGGSLSGHSVGIAAYLSARYESHREATDFSLLDFLKGNTELNPAQDGLNENSISGDRLDQVAQALNLSPLLGLPVSFLSNGQGRRARIARALLQDPMVLLLDEPFLGLDPLTVAGLSPLLQSLAARSAPRIIMSSRPQDPLPNWVTHLICLRTDCQVGLMGPKHEVLRDLSDHAARAKSELREESEAMPIRAWKDMGRELATSRDGRWAGDRYGNGDIQRLGKTNDASVHPEPSGEAIVQMDGCVVRYGSKTVLGNWSQETTAGEKEGLVWTVRRGERWGVFGPNGSGKTTIVSLLCSDHPQAYSLPLKLFGQGRLPDRGDGRPPLTLWDIQSRIGHSSPEVHRHMPRDLSIRQVLENAWADTFRCKPKLSTESRDKVDAVLGWFEPELNPVARQSPHPPEDGARTGKSHSWADDHMFGRQSFSSQRVALFLRAVIKKPDLVVLDEAFSGMDGTVRDKCMRFLAQGEQAFETHVTGVLSRREAGPRIDGLSDNQALICISHIREECPDCVREWLCLPDTNTGLPARFGRLPGPLAADHAQWNNIWGVGKA